MANKISVATTMGAAAIGVAAGAAAVTLADKKNRKKVSKIVASIANTGRDFAQGMNKKTTPVVKEARKQLKKSL